MSRADDVGIGITLWTAGGLATGIVLSTATDLFGADGNATLPQVVAVLILWPLIAFIGLIFGIAEVGEAAFYLFQDLLRSGA